MYKRQGYNNKNIYKNPYALELGYKTSDDISSEIHADNIFEYQNALLSRIVGHLVQCYKTCTAEKTKNNDGYSWTVTSPEQAVSYTHLDVYKRQQ